MNIVTVVVYLVGYAFSLLAGQLATQKVVATIPTEADYSAELLGLVERTIYTTAWLMGKELFIAVWLGLKVFSRQWQARDLEIRRIFNRWLIGTGASLAYGIAGAEFIKHAKPGEWRIAIGLLVVLVLGTLLLAWRGDALARRART